MVMSVRVISQIKDLPHQRASPAIASPSQPAPDSRAHSATSLGTTLHFARHDRRNLFANAALRFHQSATPSKANFLMTSSTQPTRSFDHLIRRKREDGQA